MVVSCVQEISKEYLQLSPLGVEFMITGLKSGSKIESLRMLGTLGLTKYTFLMALPLRIHADVQDRVLDSSLGTSSKSGGSIFMLLSQ